MKTLAMLILLAAATNAQALECKLHYQQGEYAMAEVAGDGLWTFEVDGLVATVGCSYTDRGEPTKDNLWVQVVKRRGNQHIVGATIFYPTKPGQVSWVTLDRPHGLSVSCRLPAP